MTEEKVAPDNESRNDKENSFSDELRRNIAALQKMRQTFAPENLAKLSVEQRLEVLEGRVSAMEQSFMSSQVVLLQRELYFSAEVAEELLSQIVSQVR